ncbi:hypothetical protein, partial [Burkholderia stagnalis]|uniref:hypothetical protein n=1 Tax=Burkholderia stagnalis TaxID=1503054 RepID=UPI0016299043
CSASDSPPPSAEIFNRPQHTKFLTRPSAATSFSFTLDTSAAAPGVALTTDSGSSASDHITNVGTLNLTGIETGATVQYSVDNGAHWNTSFSAVEGTNNVQVR